MTIPIPNTPQPVSVPRPVNVPSPPDHKQNDNTVLWIILAVAAILLLILLLAMLLMKPAERGAADSGNGAGTGQTANATGEDGSNGQGEKDAAGDTGNSESGQGAEEKEQEQMAGSESEETETSSPNPQPSETEQGNSGEKETPSAENESEETKQADTKKPSETAEDKPQSLADKMTANTTDRNEDGEEETKVGGGFLGKGDATVSFFGAKGKGSKFVYVIDHSGSMVGTPLETAKKEMLSGLGLLRDHHKFNVIFYDDRFIQWDTGSKLLPATDKNKAAAKKFVSGVRAEGGTEPRPALKSAIEYKPEIIFFLTDGEFTMDVKQMSDFANKNKVHINVIQFGNGYTQESVLLKELAKQTRGDYKFVDVGNLDAL